MMFHSHGLLHAPGYVMIGYMCTLALISTAFAGWCLYQGFIEFKAKLFR